MHRLNTEGNGWTFLGKTCYEIEGSRVCSKICITEVCLLKYYFESTSYVNDVIIYKKSLIN